MREDGQLCFSSVSVQSLSHVLLFATPWIAAFESPGLPVHHQLLKFTQTHACRVGDAIQPSHPLLSPSPPAPNPSQHQGLFQWVNSSHEVAKVLDSLYIWDFFCNWLLTKVFWCFFFFFFSVLPVRAPNLTMQCAQTIMLDCGLDMTSTLNFLPLPLVQRYVLTHLKWNELQLAERWSPVASRWRWLVCAPEFTFFP